MDRRLLKTKFITPSTRPELVSRPRLLEMLNTGLFQDNTFTSKLTLISAPAGFGKTTLLSEWLDGNRHDASWVTLDRRDNDPVQYWSCIIKALQQKAPGCGKSFLSYMQSGEANVTDNSREDLVTGLINDLAEMESPFMLILDDYHLITNDRIHKEFSILLENLPEMLHLGIATRSDPPLPLARLRARGEMREIRQADLKFNTGETLAIMKNLAHRELSAADAGELTSRTEGWAVGLQMAAVTLRGKQDASHFIRSFSGSNRFILDYLSEEIFKILPEEKKRFLLYSSVLEHLTGPLCQAVTGLENSQALLEELDRSNLFIVPLDDERMWYRYHHLFAELLLHKLRQTEPGIIPKLHARASRWHEESNYFEAAVEHAFASQDEERAAFLLHDYVEKLWNQGRQGTLLGWLQALSEEMLKNHPKLKLYLALLLIVSGCIPEAKLLAKEVEQDLAGAGTDIREKERCLYTGMVETIRAYAATLSGDSAAISTHAEKALKLLPDEEILWRGITAVADADALGYNLQLKKAEKVYTNALKDVSRGDNKDIYLSCSSKLAMCLWYQGRLKDVAKLSRKQLSFIEETGMSQTAKAGGVYTLWAEILREWNRLDEARELLEKSRRLGERENNHLLRAWCHLFLLRFFYSLGKFDDLSAALDRMDLWRIESSFPRYAIDQILPFKVKLYLAGGGSSRDELVKLTEKLHFSPERYYDFYNEEWIMAHCRLLDALDRREEAVDQLKQLVEACAATHRKGKQIEALTLLSVILLKDKQSDLSLQHLEQALSLGEPEGYLRVFLDHGSLMAELLSKALKKEIMPSYSSRLLASFSEANEEKVSDRKDGGLLEPLTDRETEILQLISRGLSNKDIAQKLFLSVSTVKWYTSNIYGKLSVANRTEAVARARSLDIL